MRRVKEIIHYHCDGILNKKWLGKGIVVVIMDTGIAPHPELLGRVLCFHDFVMGRGELYDDNGHGTHVAGIIAGKRIGIAPESNLIILKVLDEKGNGKTEYSMAGFRWILENQEKYNIRIVNISMGMEMGADEVNKRRILSAVELLWNRGIVVVAAAGNLGPREGSITIPGLSEHIITVGSSDVVYSGRGSLKENILKPDLVAPGYRILSSNARWNSEKESLLMAKSGTSMSTAVVAGAIADLLSKEPYTSNFEIKRRLKRSCEDLKMDAMTQGSGLLNVKKLLE